MSTEEQLDYEEESADQQRGRQDDESDLPVKEGAVFGAIAVVATYFAHLFVTLVASARTTPEITLEQTSDDMAVVATDLVSSWVAAGWSYVASFGVGFEAAGESATITDAPNNVAAIANPPFFLIDTVLFLATVGAVVAAGYAVARYTEADDAVEAVKAGVTAVPPYLAFAVIAAFLMTHTYSEDVLVQTLVGDSSTSLGNVATLEYSQFFNDEGNVISDVEFGPATIDAILFGGIVVPAVLAAAGGLLTQWRDAVETAVTAVNER
ncbi:hypothetical protein [Natrinema salifodinae]|uniref:DUF7978 domain-containing protein n=1 Tax=Natrinema salifodinae TaxID=1202768 RepID=A0A1I0QIG6_9EURY|nr:hypothetical protein [Natrinema salifodinae]SEW26972.1 hypothetical protein SAMN05216285_3632 [Natrinema salifodinae]